MICKKPFRRGALAFGCGQCLPCRIDKKRLWKHRLILEGTQHEHAAFITLTYSDDFLPSGGTLVPKHTQDWIKRLREHVAPQKLRYFLVGEYGEQSERPHYHAIVFGFPPCSFFSGESAQDLFMRRKCPCDSCSLVRVTWGMGNTDVGSFTDHSANYVVGYVTKKMTRDVTDAQKDFLKGRHPEFTRMSRKPGIGAGAVAEFGKTLGGLLFNGDVPAVLKHGSKTLPLGRYLRRKIRESYGLSELGVPKEVLTEAQKEMLRVQEARLQEEVAKGKTVVQAYQVIKEERQQQALNKEANYKVFKRKIGI